MAALPSARALKSPVFFTTETIARELDWQLWVAAVLAERGVPSVIGTVPALTTAARYADGGTVVGRLFEPAFPGVDLSVYRHFKERGFTFVHLDEEGAVFQGDEARWRRTLDRRLDTQVLSMDDVICTWGSFQADHYRGQHANDSRSPRPRVHTTGHPRFDLYKPGFREFFSDSAARVAKLVGGDYVLLNTNISIANHGQGLKYVFSKRAGFDPTDSRRQQDHLDHWAYATQVFTSLVRLAHTISVERSDLKVVVRPHPSESLETYQTILGQLGNIVVTREEAVGGWIASTRAVIQHSCTTAIECATAGVPVIDYCPVRDARYDKALPDAVALPCETPQAVLDQLRRLDGKEPFAWTPAPWTRSVFQNLEGEALPKLLDVILSTVRESGHFDAAGYRSRRVAERAWDRLKSEAGRVSPLHRRMRAYAAGKFPGFTSSLLERRMEQLGRIHKVPKWTLLDPMTISITP